MKRYIVHSHSISDFRTMCDAFGAAVSAPDNYFGYDLQSFDDCFFGYIALDIPCEFVWRDSNDAKNVLDSTMLEDYCRDKLLTADDPDSLVTPEGKTNLAQMLNSAEAGAITMFDVVVETIQSVPERLHSRQITLILA